MELLGIGPLEFLFVIVIILLVINPKDIEKTARGVGHWLNRLYKSENYRMIQQASQELRHLPQRLAREANLEALKKTADVTPPSNPLEAWTRELPPASPDSTPPPEPPAPDDKPPP